jgi:hypothetical protein
MISALPARLDRSRPTCLPASQDKAFNIQAAQTEAAHSFFAVRV